MSADPYWKSLLSMSTALTDKQEEDEIRKPRSLDDENRKWLDQVMSDLVKDTDPSAQLKNIMKSLHCYASGPDAITFEDRSKISELTEHLEDLLQYAALTRQFINDGGVLMIQQFLAKHCESLQSLFCQCIQTFAENNPPAQHAVAESGLLEFLLNFLGQETTDKNAGLKFNFLSSISATVRSDEKAFEKFLSLQGPESMTKLVGESAQKYPRIGGKSGRILASIAYTMQDSRKFADVLIPYLVECYSYLVKVRALTHSAEIEFVREFFDHCVPREKLPATSHDLLIESFKSEPDYKKDVHICELIEKFE